MLDLQKYLAYEEAISSFIDRIDFAEIQRREADILSLENGAFTYNI